MKKHRRSDQFIFGLAAGLIVGLLGGLGLALARLGGGPVFATKTLDGLHTALDWASANLGLSLPVFAVVLGLFVHSLLTLQRRIDAGRPLDQVAQADHLTDTWTSLFFGVGVIWTAIGMRGALLFALGDPATTAQDGAFAVLQRMVNGGILVALSTTIFGGVGGYVMRVVKTVTVGASLKRYYESAANQSAAGIQTTLSAIEKHLATQRAHTPEAQRDTRHVKAALD